MENERKKKFQDYAPPEQKPSGGYNLNGVYYSRDGQRLDDQPKKSWSQREYERAEREKIHCRAKREQRESEVDAQGNPVKDNSGVKKVIAIVVIVLGVVAIFGIVGMYLKSDNGAVGLIREAIQTIRDDDSSHPSENFHNDAEADSKSKTPDGKFKNLNGENVSYVHGFNTFSRLNHFLFIVTDGKSCFFKLRKFTRNRKFVSGKGECIKSMHIRHILPIQILKFSIRRLTF